MAKKVPHIPMGCQYRDQKRLPNGIAVTSERADKEENRMHLTEQRKPATI